MRPAQHDQITRENYVFGQMTLCPKLIYHIWLWLEVLDLEAPAIFSTISLGYGIASCKCWCVGDIKHDPAGNLYSCKKSTDVRCRAPYEPIRCCTTAAGTAEISCDKIGIIGKPTIFRIAIVVFTSCIKLISEPQRSTSTAVVLIYAYNCHF